LKKKEIKAASIFVTIVVISAIVGCSDSKPNTETKMDSTSQLHKGKFGTCCTDLADCMAQPNSTFRVEDTGVLYLSIAYVETDEGLGWFDHAAVFCPFCGIQLQTREQIANSSAESKEKK